MKQLLSITRQGLQIYVRKFLIVFSSVILFSSSSFGQLLTEDFTYTVGQAITANGWTAHNGGGTSPIVVSAPTISYSGFVGSGVGNEITMATSGEDDNKVFTAQTSGNVYAAFLVNITTATTTGDYFLHFGQTATGSTFIGKVFARKDVSNNLAFGVSKGNSTASTAASTGFTFSLGTTYLIVLKYSIVAGLTNDKITLYVNPATDGIEPASPTLTALDSTAADFAAGVGSIALRQGTAANAPTLKLDGIRVGTTWASVVPVGTTAPVISTNATPSVITSTNATLGGNVTSDGNSAVTGRGIVWSQTSVNATPAIGGTGVTQESASGTTGTFSLTTSGSMPVNTQMSYRAYAINAIGTSYGGASGTTFFTSANVPGKPTITNPTTNTLDITIAVNSNPASTQFAIQDSVSGNYVQANGTVSASTVWQIASTWGTKTITGLNPSTTYYFRVKARNGATPQVETAFGLAGSGMTSAATTPTIVVTGTLATFVTVAGTPSANQSYHVTASNLTDTLRITAPASYEVATNAPPTNWSGSQVIAGSAGSIPDTIVYVRLNSALASAYNGSIVNSSTGASSVNVTVHGIVKATEPTIQSAITFGSVTTSSMVVNFIGGNGTSRILVAKQGSAVTFIPADTIPPAGVDSNFTTATDLGSGNKIVYSNTGNSVTVTGLSGASTYYFAVYEYNGSGVTINYFIVNPGTGNKTTITAEPTTASTVSFNCGTSTIMKVNFTGGNGSRRIVVVHANSAVTYVPTDGITSTGVNSNFSTAADQGSGNKIVFDTSLTSATITGLTSGVTYFVRVYEYNGLALSSNYLTGSFGSGSTTTAGPLSYSTTGSTYYQGFDNLPSSGSSTFSGAGPFFIGADTLCVSGMQGWQFGKIGGSGANAIFTVSNGSSTSGSAYSFGTTSSSERSLGSLATGTIVSNFGVLINNNTSDVLTTITIAYTGEQWRNGGSTNQNKLKFSYSVGASNISSGIFTPVIALDFASPTSSGSSATLDGNNPANRANITATFTLDSNWAPGQTLVLKWIDTDDPGSDDGLAVDSFFFRAIAPVSPLAQDSTITFSNLSTVSMTANWLNGTGARRIVKINKVNLFTNPVNGITYAANSVYSGSGEQVAYNGTGSSVNVTGLLADSTYFFRVYAYNGTGSASMYNTNTAFGNPNSQITNPPSAATQLVIISVNGSVSPVNIVVGKPFYVVVQSRDGGGSPQPVGTNTNIDLFTFSGIGTTAGTTAGIILQGTTIDTIFGVLYDTPDFGVQLDAYVVSGDALTDGISASFDVLDSANHLVFSGVPPSAIRNTSLSSFSAQAYRPNATLDNYYNGTVTLSVVSGPGAISGTLIQPAVSGVATFSNISFDTPGSYVIRADAPGLTFVNSSTIYITGNATFTELVVPKYIGSKTTATLNNARTPIAICYQIDSLVPNTVYDIKAALDTTTAASTSYGAGNIGTSNSFNGATQTLTAAFTTNAQGSSGPRWIFIQPTTSRFDAGQIHNLRLGFGFNGVLNSIPVTPNFVGIKTIQALDIASTARTAATTDDGAFLKGSVSPCVAGKFILVYDNINGTGNPMFVYQSRPAADTNTTQSELPTAINDVYRQAGTSAAGDYPAIIPIGANNPNGVRRIEARNADNTIFSSAIDSDGVWPGGANTTTITRRSVATLLLSDAGMNSVSISSITSTPVSCASANDGTASVTATGSGTLSYLWSSGQTTASITGVSSGNDTVTVTDSKGCSAKAIVTIAQPSTSTISASGPLTFCNGDSVTLSSGAGANHYAWSTNPSGDTLQSIVVKTSGSYYVTVTTGSCTQASLPVTVTVNNFALNGTIFSENAGNPGATTLISSYTGWQNTTPIIFTSTGSAQADVRTSIPSNYAGASGNGNVFFGTTGGNDKNLIISGINTLGYSSSGLTLSFGLIKSASSASSDSLTVDVSNDGITYIVLGKYVTSSTTVWSQFTAPVGSIPSTSNLRIRFSKNNGSQFRVDDIKLTGLSSSLVVAASGPVTMCDSGSVTLTSNSLTSNVWSPGGQTTKSIVVTASGSYTVTVTDGNGCKATSSPVNVLIDPRPVVTVSTTPASCTNINDGTASVAATGTGTLNYLWSNGNTTTTISNLFPGSYSVTVTSSVSGCSTTKTAVVGQPAFSNITASGPLTFCTGDSVTLTAGAGASYMWSTGAVTQSIIVKASGSYTVTVDNGSGCIQTSSPTVVTVNSFLFSGTIYSENNGTAGGSGVAISTYSGFQNSLPVIYSSTSSSQSDMRQTGTLSNTYPGSSGGTHIFMGSSTTDPQRDFIIEGINTLGYSGMTLSFGLLRSSGTNTADSISVDISTDGINYSTLAKLLGTTSWARDTVPGLIPAVANLRIRFNKNSTTNQFRIDDVLLNGTTSTVQIASSGPTTICGTGGVRLTSNILTGNIWSPTSATTKSILATVSGSYTVTASGSTGCPATSAPLIVQINPKPTVSISSVINASCFAASNGSITASATGGTGTLNYSWNTSPVQLTSTASSLAAGTYTVTVTDANSCSAKDSATITQPAAVTVTAAVSANVVCQGATVSLSSTGTTTTNLTFTNSTPVAIPDSTVASGIVPVTSSIVVSGMNSNSLTSGQIDNVKINSLTHTYDGDLIIRLIAPDGRSIILSNRKGLSGDNFINTVFSSSSTTALTSAPFTGTFKPDTTATASAAFNTFNGVNPNGTWKLFVSDNQPVDTGFINSWSITFNNPIAFAWTSSPAGFTSSLKNPGSVTPSSVGLGNVTYNVVATNLTTGCSSPVSSVTVNVLQAPTAIASSTNVTCHNDSNGTVSVSASGGTPPYRYSWNTSPVQLTQTVTGLKGGLYTVTVTDTNGCTVKADTSVINPAKLIATAAITTPVGCYGGQATVEVTATGGNPGYTGTGLNAENAGIHTYIVTDTKGCTDTATVTVTQPSQIIVTATNGTISCNGGTTTVVVSATGGTGIYTIGTGTFTGVPAGIHSYNVFDNAGCPGSVNDTITQPDSLIATITVTNVSCPGLNDGKVHVSQTGGTGPYTYSWTNCSGVTTGSVVIAASIDNTIYEENTSYSNGSGEYLPVGNDDIGSKHRSLISFDIAGNIPAGSTITGTSLSLHMSRTSGSSGNQPINLYKVLESWGEGTSNPSQPGVGTPATTNDATWLDRFFGTNSWTTQGGEFSGSASATTNVNGIAFYSWSDPVMVSDIQNWLNAPPGNYGWLIKGAETGIFQAKRFDSRNNSVAGNVPVLTINYEMPAAILGTTDSLTNLNAGSYCVTVTDAHGCSTTATAVVNDPPGIEILSFFPQGCNGDIISIAGSGFTGVTDVQFNGTSASFIVVDDNNISATVPAGATSGNITISKGACFATTTGSFTISCGAIVTVRAFIQGFYDDACVLCGTMKPVMLTSNVAGATNSMVDSVTIELHNASSPYGLIESASGILSTTGYVNVSFTGAVVNGNYFIVFKHRNTIETWSRTPQTIASTYTYDFTSDSSQAYQNQFPVDPPPYGLIPMIKVEPGIWAVYNGDVGSSAYGILDGSCDISDGNWLEQDANVYNNIQIPDYYITDITGDGVPDISDFNLEETNFLIDGTNYVQSQYPR